MAEIINLRQARKLLARAAAEKAAAANRARWGRSKADRQSADAAAKRESKALDGHRLEERRPVDGDPLTPIIPIFPGR